MLSDQQELLKNINQKEAQAWKELYRYYYGALCNYALGIVKDRPVAEDVVQECLVTVWRSGLVFTDLKALSVYLYRSVHNNTLKYLRDRQVDVRRLQKWQVDQPDNEELDFYKVVEEELIRKLRLAIAGLPERQRKILQLSIEGASVQQIAEQLEISINTVKTQKKRAYVWLKEQLKDNYFILLILGWL